jgi:hypothetical protein
MKPIAIVLIVFSAALCAAGAAVVGLVFWTTPAGFERELEPSAPAPVQRAAENPADGALAAQLDRLGERLGALEDEVRRLRDVAAREPVAAIDDGTDPERLAAAFEITPEQREVIEKVLADVRAAEEAERDERRLRREEDEILERAERVAKEIGLSAADQKTLADHYSVAAVRRRELLERAREDGWDRTTIRDDFIQLRDWSEQAMVDVFGADLARQIQEADRSSRFGGRAGPDGFGRGRNEGGGGRGNESGEGGGGGGRGRRGN